MKTTYFTAISLVLLVLATVFSSFPATVEATPKGNAYGYWGFPGNSYYGQTHNMNNFARKYEWRGEQYASFDDLVEHIRAMLEEQRKFHSQSWNYGYSTNYSDSEVDVTTKYATNIGETRATLRGEVDLNKSDYAHVWFMYGTNMYNMTYQTTYGYVENDGKTIFSGTVYNLRDNTRYYYRAIAEDDNGDRAYGSVFSLVTGDDNDDDDNDGDNPDVTTKSARNIEDTSAYLEGEVDMNDFSNGDVFFVYGEDKNQVEDVEDDFDTYNDIDEDGDDLQKVLVDGDLDGAEDYSTKVTGLDEDTRYYYAIGVAYEDEDDDDTIILGSVKSFTTGDSDDDDDDNHPDVNTGTVKNISDDSADAFGSVDMNDFDDGIVFFVFGEDRNQIEDVEDDYDTYNDIDEDEDDLQKVKVYSNLDGDGTFELNMNGLDGNTTIYYAIGVEYEDEDGDDVLKLGSVKSFVTD
jgi:hypothetical protein